MIVRDVNGILGCHKTTAGTTNMILGKWWKDKSILTMNCTTSVPIYVRHAHLYLYSLDEQGFHITSTTTSGSSLVHYGKNGL